MAEEKKKKRLFEKILMGAVIGGAIGSVVGATLTHKNKNEPTIEELPLKKRRRIVEFLKKFSRKKKGLDELREIPNEMAIEEKDHD